MNKVVITFSVAILFVMFQACHSQKQVAEETPPAPPKQEAPETTEKTEKKPLKEMWLGSELVSETSSRLSTRLSLNSQTSHRTSQILQATFLSKGGDLNKSYPIDEARQFGKDLIMDSRNQLMEILSDEEKARFKQILAN